MKIFFQLIIFIIYSSSIVGQNRNNIWCFGDSAGINFSNLSNPISFTSNVRGRGCSVSIADSLGDLLFYASTFNKPYVPLDCYQTMIWNNQNLVVANGDTVVGDSWFHELSIVPFPQFSNKFYLFSINVLCQYGLSYSIVDMSLNGGNGGITLKNYQITNGVFDDGSCVVKNANGRDWWLIIHQWQTNSFYIYLITPTGISAPTIQNIGSIHSQNLCNFSFNSATNKFLVSNYWGLIEIFDFDRCSGSLSLYQTVSPENSGLQKKYAGSSISPNGRFIYVSNTDNIFGDSLRLDQFDLTAPNIAASKINIYTSQVPASGGMHAVATDGKIYMACLYEEGFPYSDTTHNIYTDNLSVINHPDSLGLACDFQPFSFYLGGNRCYWGLPNNPNYDLGRDSGSVCDTLQWTGIMDANQSMQLTATIYPNPAKDKLTLQLSYLINQAELIIYNALGEKCFSEKIITPSSTLTIDVSKLKEGLYFLQIKSPQKILSLKFCKE